VISRYEKLEDDVSQQPHRQGKQAVRGVVVRQSSHTSFLQPDFLLSPALGTAEDDGLTTSDYFGIYPPLYSNSDDEHTCFYANLSSQPDVVPPSGDLFEQHPSPPGCLHALMLNNKDNETHPMPANTERKTATPKLRSATRKQRRTPLAETTTARRNSTSSEAYTDKPAPLAAEELRSRQCHNLVEKQYRIRLNAQFERLLGVLPPGSQDQRPEPRPDGGDDGAVVDKRLSKGDVLDAAIQRIKELEARNSTLVEERERFTALEAVELAAWRSLSSYEGLDGVMDGGENLSS
jgi:hypothetical protein